jgi:hypothetical protein
MTLVKTDLGFLRIIQKFKIVGRETNNNKGLHLFKFANRYKEVYNWFDYLKAKGHFI